MLSVRDLRFAYTPGPTVFDGLSFEVGRGVTWVVGDESSGKTTLLRLIAGELAGGGTVDLDGRPLHGAAARSPVAWCDAGDAALDRLPVATVLDRLRASSTAFDEAVLARHVDGFGLGPHLGKAMFQLSTGSRRKVGLAGVFAAGAPVTLLDDPAAALDAPSVAHLLRTLAEIDREPSRICLAAVHAVPAGIASPRVLGLSPRR